MAIKATAASLAAVTLNVFLTVLIVALALTGYGCSGDRDRVPSTPLSPSPTVPSPPAPALELWRLTTTIVSVEGSACMWNQPVGAKLDWTLSVERSGTEVRFVYDVGNPHDNLLFVGAIDEQSFTAASDTYNTTFPCAGRVTFSSSVVGSFSSDGRALSGREGLTYRVHSGNEFSDLTITFEWHATRI